MANGKKRITKKRSVAVRRVGRRSTLRRMSAPSRPQAQGSFGRLFSTGVRTLVSCLPGSKALLPVTDFILKTIGLTLLQPSNGVFADVQNTGMGSKFTLNYINAISGSKAVTYRGKSAGNQGSRLMVTCPYTEARLVDLTLSVAPINIVNKRSGDWSIGFYPFCNATEKTFFTGDEKIPDRIGIERAPLVATGSASQPLSLRFRPRVTDGWIYAFHDLAEAFGGVCIRYNDFNRSSYGEFNGEDFAMDFVLKARCELRSIAPDSIDSYSYTDSVSDVLNKNDHGINPFTHKVTHLPSGSTYNVRVHDTVPTRSGTSLKGEIMMMTPSLRSMEIH